MDNNDYFNGEPNQPQSQPPPPPQPPNPNQPTPNRYNQAPKPFQPNLPPTYRQRGIQIPHFSEPFPHQPRVFGAIAFIFSFLGILFFVVGFPLSIFVTSFFNIIGLILALKLPKKAIFKIPSIIIDSLVLGLSVFIIIGLMCADADPDSPIAKITGKIYDVILSLSGIN